jgi:hypothetical protein
MGGEERSSLQRDEPIKINVVMRKQDKQRSGFYRNSVDWKADQGPTEAFAGRAARRQSMPAGRKGLHTALYEQRGGAHLAARAYFFDPARLASAHHAPLL